MQSPRTAETIVIRSQLLSDLAMQQTKGKKKKKAWKKTGIGMLDEKNKMIVWVGSIPREETKLDDGIKEPKTRVKIDLLPAPRISQLEL